MFAALITANSAASFRVNSICLRERAVSCDCKGGREMWEGKKKRRKKKRGECWELVTKSLCLTNF